MKGWLRLWIALTIIWLVGLAAYTWMTWPAAGVWIPPDYAIPKDSVDAVRVAHLRALRLRHSELMPLLPTLVVLPPAAILSLGLLARWVYRGFKNCADQVAVAGVNLGRDGSAIPSVYYLRSRSFPFPSK